MIVPRGHEDICRFKVSVDDPLLVGVLDAVTCLNEKMEAFTNTQAMPRGKRRDRLAGDQFHDEERAAGAGLSGIEDLGDIRMIHQGQRLAFGLKAVDDPFGIHPRLENLYRNAAFDGPVLVGEVNGSEAPFAQLG